MRHELHPLRSFFRASGYLLTGRLHFARQHLGERLTMVDGRQFTVFRHLIVAPNSNIPEPGAIFCVRFRLVGMSSAANKVFSWLPVLFFTGLPGFRAKLWGVAADSGEFLGLYAWQTLADAQNYASSFAMRFMMRRATPGSVSHKILSTKTEIGAKWQALLYEIRRL